LGSSDPLQASVAGFLEDVASATPAPGAGAVASLVVALAAALVEMAARLSPGEDDARAAAEALRARAAPLGQADADAYEEFLAVRRRGEDDSAARDRTVAVPLEIAECAAEAAGLAARLAGRGNPSLLGEAVAAALAAGAGAEIACTLVSINVGGGPDERLDQARTLAAAAADHAAVARRGSRPPSAPR
jgi:formiminotetrahydrofolate cyclodeaminase